MSRGINKTPVMPVRMWAYNLWCDVDNVDNPISCGPSINIFSTDDPIHYLYERTVLQPQCRQRPRFIERHMLVSIPLTHTVYFTHRVLLGADLPLHLSIGGEVQVGPYPFSIWGGGHLTPRYERYVGCVV